MWILDKCVHNVINVYTHKHINSNIQKGRSADREKKKKVTSKPL